LLTRVATTSLSSSARSRTSPKAATEARHISREQSRWIKIASAFPRSPTTRNRRGTDTTDWIPTDRHREYSAPITMTAISQAASVVTPSPALSSRGTNGQVACPFAISTLPSWIPCAPPSLPHGTPCRLPRWPSNSRP
jgi:hypothetical protein